MEKRLSDEHFFQSLALANIDLDVLKISPRLRRSCGITLKNVTSKIACCLLKD